MRRPVTVTRTQARDLKRIAEKMVREGGTPHALVRREWLEDMARELRQLANGYDGSPLKAKELFEALLVAEVEGVAGVDDIRRRLGRKVLKRKAA
jgi:hypothetical protein